MRGRFFITAFLLLFNFSFVFLVGESVGFDRKLKDLIDFVVVMKSDNLRFYLKDFAYKQGFTKKLTEILEIKNVDLPDQTAFLNFSKKIFDFCKKEDISGNVLVITLIYFERVLDKLKDSYFESPKELSAAIIKNFVGCFIIAYKYYEDHWVFVSDILELGKIGSYTSAFGGKLEIKQHLMAAEKGAFEKLNFNASVSEEIFEHFSSEIANIALDEDQVKEIENLDKEVFVHRLAYEVNMVLLSNGVCLKNPKRLEEFFCNFILHYPKSDDVYDVLMLSYVYFKTVVNGVIGSVSMFNDDVLLFVLYGCFMLADSMKDVDWKELIPVIFPEHLRGVNASKLYTRIVSLAAKVNFDGGDMEVFLQKITLVG